MKANTENALEIKEGPEKKANAIESIKNNKKEKVKRKRKGERREEKRREGEKDLSRGGRA